MSRRQSQSALALPARRRRSARRAGGCPLPGPVASPLDRAANQSRGSDRRPPRSPTYPAPYARTLAVGDPAPYGLTAPVTPQRPYSPLNRAALRASRVAERLQHARAPAPGDRAGAPSRLRLGRWRAGRRASYGRFEATSGRPVPRTARALRGDSAGAPRPTACIQKWLAFWISRSKTAACFGVPCPKNEALAESTCTVLRREGR